MGLHRYNIYPELLWCYCKICNLISLGPRGVHIFLVDWYINYCWSISVKLLIEKCFGIIIFAIFVPHKKWINSLNLDNNMSRSTQNDEPFNPNVHVSHEINEEVFPISDIELLFCIDEWMFDIFCFSFCHTFINSNHVFFYHLGEKRFKSFFIIGTRIG